MVVLISSVLSIYNLLYCQSDNLQSTKHLNLTVERSVLEQLSTTCRTGITEPSFTVLILNLATNFQFFLIFHSSNLRVSHQQSPPRSKQRAAESQRVANLIMERQKQAQIMEQAQRNQNKGGHIFTVSPKYDPQGFTELNSNARLRVRSLKASLIV